MHTKIVENRSRQKMSQMIRMQQCISSVVLHSREGTANLAFPVNAKR